MEEEFRGGWKRRSIDWWSQPKGGRGLAKYEDLLQFKRRDLRGKRVLDLGAGPEGKFARELAESGINATVVSLSPDLIYPEYRLKVAKPALAALGQTLPFADETFDRIFSLNVIPHLLSKDSYLVFIREVARILKKNGIARIGIASPDFVRSEDGLISQDIVDFYYVFIDQDDTTSRYLKDQKVSVSKREIPRELYREKIQHPTNKERFEVTGSVIILKKKS